MERTKEEQARIDEYHRDEDQYEAHHAEFSDWFIDNKHELIEAFIEEYESEYAAFLEKEYSNFREEMKQRYKEPMDWR